MSKRDVGVQGGDINGDKQDIGEKGGGKEHGEFFSKFLSTWSNILNNLFCIYLK